MEQEERGERDGRKKRRTTRTESVPWDSRHEQGQVQAKALKKKEGKGAQMTEEREAKRARARA